MNELPMEVASKQWPRTPSLAETHSPAIRSVMAWWCKFFQQQPRTKEQAYRAAQQWAKHGLTVINQMPESEANKEHTSRDEYQTKHHPHPT